MCGDSYHPSYTYRRPSGISQVPFCPPESAKTSDQPNANQFVIIFRDVISYNHGVTDIDDEDAKNKKSDGYKEHDISPLSFPFFTLSSLHSLSHKYIYWSMLKIIPVSIDSLAS